MYHLVPYTSVSVISIACSLSLNECIVMSVSVFSSAMDALVLSVSAFRTKDSFSSRLTSLFISANLSCNISVFSVSILNSHSLVIQKSAAFV